MALSGPVSPANNNTPYLLRIIPQPINFLCAFLYSYTIFVLYTTPYIIIFLSSISVCVHDNNNDELCKKIMMN